LRRRTRDPDADEPAYEPGPQERSVLEAYLQRLAEAAPRMKVLDGEAMSIAADHPDPAVGQVLLMAALGTADHDFFGGVVRQLGSWYTTAIACWPLLMCRRATLLATM
jgi:hypothetical protein